jgi:hypothetical protein
MLLILEGETASDTFSRCTQDHLLIVTYMSVKLAATLALRSPSTSETPDWRTTVQQLANRMERGHSMNFNKAEVIANIHAC